MSTRYGGVCAKLATRGEQNDYLRSSSARNEFFDAEKLQEIVANHKATFFNDHIALRSLALQVGRSIPDEGVQILLDVGRMDRAVPLT